MKNRILKVNIIILSVILIGFTFVIGSFYISFRTLFKKDIAAISEASSQNIYSQINNLIDIPLNVSITMANDTFLRDFIQNELQSSTFDVEKVKEYLKKYQHEYNFNSVFLICTQTNNYYHFEKGLDRVLVEGDPENIWYYDFLAQPENYALNIDNDEADNDYMTMFVNCKVKNEKNQVVAVVGVGLKTPYIQDFISSAEDNYDVSAYLIEADGTVVLSEDYTKFDNINIFEDNRFSDMATAINTKTQSNTNAQWYHSNNIDGYVITKYIPNLQWFLIVEKNTHVFMDNMTKQIILTAILSLFVIAIVSVIIAYLVVKHNKEILSLSQKDRLTNIRNREAYEREMKKYAKTISEYHSFGLGIVDINNLKHINDNYGHQAGDEMIIALSTSICSVFKNTPVYRIGGDEFAIAFINMEPDEIWDKWKTVETLLTEYSNSHSWNASAAFGVAFWDFASLNTIEKVFKSADDSMYENKQKSKL